jgi:hypothetical protein
LDFSSSCNWFNFGPICPFFNLPQETTWGYFCKKTKIRVKEGHIWQETSATLCVEQG